MTSRWSHAFAGISQVKLGQRASGVCILVTLCCEGGGEEKAQVRNRPANTRHDGARTSGGKGETHETARAGTLCSGRPYVASGALTFEQEGKTTTYKTGDYVYEAGNSTNAAYNRSNEPVRIINFAILPSGWKGGSAVPPPSQ
jgi:hypothetical protein